MENARKRKAGRKKVPESAGESQRGRGREQLMILDAWLVAFTIDTSAVQWPIVRLF